MVRLKNRWLIVRVDESRHVAPPGDGSKMATSLPSKRDLFLLLSDGVIDSFGITHSGALRESKGKHDFLEVPPMDSQWPCSQNHFDTYSLRSPNK